jgi:hypothetical protein
VTLPVFKTGGRQVSLSSVGSTPTRFRHFFNSLRTMESLWNQFGLGKAILGGVARADGVRPIAKGRPEAAERYGDNLNTVP